MVKFFYGVIMQVALEYNLKSEFSQFTCVVPDSFFRNSRNTE